VLKRAPSLKEAALGRRALILRSIQHTEQIVFKAKAPYLTSTFS
jgi:hypothetical protein